MKNRRGFTLMEMMVALVMAAAVISPLYIITRGVAETSRSKQMDVEAMQRARTALDLLVRDFSRAGLFTSPNTGVDRRYFNEEVDGSTVQFRSAVSHLNRNAEGSDLVMLTGNFLGSTTYSAYAISTDTLQIIDPIDDSEACTSQFSAAYSVAQISDSSGRTMEASIDTVTYQGKICTITIESSDYHLDSFQNGDTVRVAANQTAVYFLEGLDLVRYFVDYESNAAANGGSCGFSAPLEDYSDLDIDGAVVTSTRKVLATYVVDFQVWFRAARFDANTGWTLPHYHSISSIVDEANGNFADGLKISPKMHVIPESASGTVGNNDVSCKTLVPSAGDIGPERVRSAMIQVTVRTEKSDGSVRWGVEDTDSPGRKVRQSIAPDDSIALPDGQPAFVYQLKTLTTEVEMPNLAARGDLLVL